MTATAKAYKGMGMEGGIARWYERTTRNDMAQFKQLAERVAAAVPGGEVLEIAPGPGFLSIEMARRGLRVHAVDISRTFVELARNNAAAANVQVRFQQGNASALPFEAGSMDFVVCRAAFKNFGEPVKALTEMKRVLRPGGIALLIDLRRDVPMDEIRRYVDSQGLGWLNRRMITLVFRTMLLKRAYSVEQIRSMATQAGWVEPRIETNPIGFEAWLRKEADGPA